MSRFNTKCSTCGMYYQGFHICIDMSTPEPKQPVLPKRKKGQHTSTRSDMHRASLSMAQQERWERAWEGQRDRDNEIIGLYVDGGWSYAALARKYKIGRGTILRILQKAEAEGLVVIRRKPNTIAGVE